jgi:hypothetical protein
MADALGVNTGRAWTDMDLWDLTHCIRYGDSIEEIAGYLGRAPNEVAEKASELRGTLAEGKQARN